MKYLLLVMLAYALLACQHNAPPTSEQEHFFAGELPGDLPLDFLSQLVPAGKLVHKGIISPDYQQYYFTVSDHDFTNFQVMTSRKLEGKWSAPEEAFFNSSYDEHGMSFSPDGKVLYFSSTRPVGSDSIPATWHLWRSEKMGDQWSPPVFIDIPNLRDKLVSHPTVTTDGTLYFHASELDYTNMRIYSAQQINDGYQAATELPVINQSGALTCTPYVAPDESCLIFAQQEEEQLKLMISYRKNEKWSTPRALNERINSNGQGNPSLSPDGVFLFYTVTKKNENNEAAQWSVKWVNTANMLN